MQLNKPRSPDRDINLTEMTASRPRHHATDTPSAVAVLGQMPGDKATQW